MTDALEHFTKGSIVALICVAAILKFILSKRDEKTGLSLEKLWFVSKFSRENFKNLWENYLHKKSQKFTLCLKNALFGEKLRILPILINTILGKGIEEKDHEVLRRRYLLIYGLGALGDWLQGPYVYRLYSLHNLKG